MKYLKYLTILIFVISFSACWSANKKKVEQNKNTQTTTNVVNNKDDFEKVKELLNKQKENPDGRDSASKEEEKKIKSDKPLKPNNGNLSPMETLKEFDAATIAKDSERIKKVVTKKTLEYFEGQAKKLGLTFKELVERPSEMPTVETPEMRNEKITGNKATVEAKNRLLGTFDKYPLVKEGGVWKVAYDKYLKQKLEELNKGAKPKK